MFRELLSIPIIALLVFATVSPAAAGSIASGFKVFQTLVDQRETVLEISAKGG